MHRGNGWPDSKQKLLLKACLFSDSKAQDAWKLWTKQIDLDSLDPASLKLLPLVCRNPSIEILKDPLLIKCRGYYRKTWVANQVNWKQALTPLSKLIEQTEDKVVLLKGIAMILAYYEDFGIRPIGDIDILLKANDLPIAKSVLTQLGWRQDDPRLDLENPNHTGRWHAVSFLDKDNHDLDLHWSFIHEQVPVLDKAVWEQARPLPAYPGFYVPTPTHLFLQTCIHGSKHSPVPLIRWVADAMTVLKKGIIDWDELVFLSKSARITIPMTNALEYLAFEFAAPIPSSTLSSLRNTSSHWLERRESRSYSRGNTYMASWYRFCLNQNLLTLRAQILNIHNYLQITARLESAWLIPFFSIYWIARRLIKNSIYFGKLVSSRFMKKF